MIQDQSTKAVCSTLYNFGAIFKDGNTPKGRLIIDSLGNLYGVLNTGGLDQGDTSGNGVVFMLATDTHGESYEYKVLHRFAGGPADGARPVGGLVMGPDGILYGTAAGGGTGWAGTVFKLAPNGAGGWDLTNLYNFSAAPPATGKNSDGAAPTSHLIISANGTLFGTTSAGGTNGGGTVFSLTPMLGGGYSFNNLHNFPAIAGYNYFVGGLLMDVPGNIYGLVSAGGEYSSGEIFGLFVSGDQTYTYKSLYSFPLNDYDPVLPFGSLVMDNSGQMFGTTNRGGDISGTVFSYPSGKTPATPTTVYEFNELNGEFSPGAGVIIDSVGNLFGTAQYSSAGQGGVYKLTKKDIGTYVYTALFEFNGNAGEYPENTLVADPMGRLYGTTSEGGKHGYGTVFRIGETAEAMAVMQGGVVVQIVVTNPGRGYASPPTVTLTPSNNGATAQASATISNGSVTSITVTNAGSGYDFGPQVIFPQPF
ncbi:choice-of-anchor tandem repeat GloVer-containing protein [Labrenzia sp. CE80]|uniref:choice-of-anchor tandem repeat GloVer-containing protein n=1 Tax=Labrenzia sp. CE80 TaxID=1788986 RepID=UPI00129B37DB|nr:choice-of-anchor tandem repeat GloVer-containing protein [Labrenzia sp. CE80]